MLITAYQYYLLYGQPSCFNVKYLHLLCADADILALPITKQWPNKFFLLYINRTSITLKIILDTKYVTEKLLTWPQL